MSKITNNQPDWVTRGKSIKQLIMELQTFENQDLEVRISLDGGTTHKPISLLKKSEGYCKLVNCELDEDDDEDNSQSSSG